MAELKISIVMLGATGATGTQALNALLGHPQVARITLLGRRAMDGLNTKGTRVDQHIVNIDEPDTYREFLPGHQAAICTLGVGQPSKVSREEFIKIDKTAVLDFATTCHEAGVGHFEILSSVGAHANSSTYYLRTKGELNEGLAALGFDRLSLFLPSMILTPNNRYGFGQAVALTLWPILNPLFVGKARKYRGIPVSELGQAMALNVFTQGQGVQALHWSEFKSILGK